MMYTGEEAKKILEEILANEKDGHYPLHEGDTGYYGEAHDQYFVAFDNTTGDCWVEEFSTEERAIHWIKNG